MVETVFSYFLVRERVFFPFFLISLSKSCFLTFLFSVINSYLCIINCFSQFSCALVKLVSSCLNKIQIFDIYHNTQICIRVCRVMRKNIFSIYLLFLSELSARGIHTHVSFTEELRSWIFFGTLWIQNRGVASLETFFYRKPKACFRIEFSRNLI